MPCLPLCRRLVASCLLGRQTPGCCVSSIEGRWAAFTQVASAAAVACFHACSCAGRNGGGRFTIPDHTTLDARQDKQLPTPNCRRCVAGIRLGVLCNVPFWDARRHLTPAACVQLAVSRPLLRPRAVVCLHTYVHACMYTDDVIVDRIHTGTLSRASIYMAPAHANVDNACDERGVGA